MEHPDASARFYAGILGKAPATASPAFVSFALATGMTLGLWSRHAVAPAIAGTGECSELVFSLADDTAVDAVHKDWTERRLPILQEPVRMGFGYTFVAADPDGHRLRVMAPARQ